MARLTINMKGSEKSLKRVQDLFYTPTKAAAIRKSIFFTAENFHDIEKLRQENRELNMKLETILQTLKKGK